MKAHWRFIALIWASFTFVDASVGLAQYGRTTPPPPPPPRQQAAPQPSVPTNNLAAPRKALTDAQTAVNQAKAAIALTRTRVSSTFEGRDDWIAARKAMAAAQAHYDAAAKRVAAALQKNPDYEKLLTGRKAAQDKLDAMKTQPKPTDADDRAAQDAQLNDAAGEILTDGYAINKMEAEARDSDGDLGAAREELADAKKAMDALQTEVTAALQVDPEYLIQVQTLTVAEQQLTAARAALVAAQKPQRTTATPSRSSGGAPRGGD